MCDDVKRIKCFIVDAGKWVPVLILFLLSSCVEGEKGKKQDVSSINPDSLIILNRKLIRDDIDKIEDYLDSNGLEMEKSGTGLFYKIIKDNKGEKASPGDIAVFSYRIRGLDGHLIYSSDDGGPKTFEVDKSYVESGWNEASKMMGQGDSAVLILPPHLAFRNIGDGNRIGPGEVLVYELRMDSLK